MALDQCYQGHDHRYPWYWHDNGDYDYNDAGSDCHQSQKQNSLNQALVIPRTKWAHEGHAADSIVVVVPGDSAEDEQRWLSHSRNLDRTRRTVRVDRIERQSPSGNGRHKDAALNLHTRSRGYLDFDSLSLDSHSSFPPLNTPSLSNHHPSVTLAAAGAAFIDSHPHGSSTSLPPQLRTYTCKGKAEMVLDQREQRREKRKWSVKQEPEVDTDATLRFLRPHLSLHDSRIPQDMDCIWEEEEECQGSSAILVYKSSTTQEAVDGEDRGRSGQPRSGYTNGGRSSNEYGYSNGYSSRGYASGGRGRAGYNGRGDDDDDDERGSGGGGDHLDYYFSQHFSSEDEDDSEDDDSEQGPKSPKWKHNAKSSHTGHSTHYNEGTSTRTSPNSRHVGPHTAHHHQTSSPPESDSDEDDVPLAKSHPTALKAQQSIRIKDRQRRKERKLEKAREKTVRNKQATVLTGSGPSVNEANLSNALGLGGMSSTQEAMLHASIPRSTSPPPVSTPITSFAAGMVRSSPQTAASPLPSATTFPSSSPSSPKFGDITTLPASVPAGTVRLRSRMGRGRNPTIGVENAPGISGAPQGGSTPVPPTSNLNQNFAGHHSNSAQTPAKVVRPMRSFHANKANPSTTQQVHQEWHAGSPSGPTVAAATSLSRSQTRGRSQSNAHPSSAAPMIATKSAPPLPSQPPSYPSHSHAATAATTSRARSRSRPPPTRNPYPTDEFGALSVNQSEPLARRSTESRRGASGGRSSSEHPRDRVEVPPVELMPPLPPSYAAPNTHLETQQLRVYISTRQRFVVVEITSVTNAGDVIGMVKAKGGLPDVQFGMDAGEGTQGVGWVVWELNADMGLERPIRPFEQLGEVQTSWSKEKTENAFMIKWTPGWEKTLRREVIPPAAPTYSGYLEYEVRRGKWNKRWLVLKDHCLYISKRDNCKDQVLLASLSNFDIYHFIHPPSKIPKEYAFAIKSTDKMSLFEDTNDYMHIFCCREGEGEKWMQRIRIARSYVLYQERNVLFAPPPSQAVPMSAPVSSGGMLGRSLTTKRRVPAQPLVQVADNDIFAKGSLLRSQV
ncbi:hypothetical protein V5O48_003836 [Marasmius crinis-equi]|uniref:PH domain-containing protein n=1 Tax=Marasmius crinis-equi TaxID=585013 RepID=A0ABR3FRT1_9AGAR